MKSQNNDASEIWKLVEDFSDSTDLPNFPGILHCRGGGKLLGSNFVLALDECLGGNEFNVLNTKELISLARTWLIIDDYLRDTHLNDKQKIAVNNLLRRIEGVILILGPSFDPDFSHIWKKRKAIQETAYINGDLNNFYSYKINKCSLVFLCLDLPNIKMSKRYSLFKRCLYNYFFALQLIDDFNDMTEDFDSLRNDNLFVAHANLDTYHYILERRNIIMRALIPYIIENINTLKAMGGIYEKHYEQARSYLESRLPKSVKYFESIFPNPFNSYFFNLKELNGISPSKIKQQINITAEETHTLT